MKEPPIPRTWDGRMARRLVRPLVGSMITPNHLTTLRLAIGAAGAAALAIGGFRWSNVGALLIVLSNFVDHTDGELARISGQSSRLGHYYDLACDAIVTVALFTGLGLGLVATHASSWLSSSPLFSSFTPIVLGGVAGFAVALIFFVRMRIEAHAGKSGVAQSFAAGFETEDVLYLLPLVTLFDVAAPFIVVAAIGASVFAVWVLIDWARVVRRSTPDALPSSS